MRPTIIPFSKPCVSLTLFLWLSTRSCLLSCTKLLSEIDKKESSETTTEPVVVNGMRNDGEVRKHRGRYLSKTLGALVAEPVVCVSECVSFGLNPPLCKAETRCKYLHDLNKTHLLREDL